MDDFNGRNILVCGMMKSGQAAARLLKQLGASVTAQDLKEFEKIEWTFLPEENGVDLYLGKNPDEIINNFDLIILSPGIPQGLPFLKKAADLSIPVWGEIELAYRLCPCPLVAITGTNGKTTTTTLVGEILRYAGLKTAVVGNIGVPFCGSVQSLTKDCIAVAEISSFQLETAHTFSPKISAVLNITPDHLNRHKTMENYCETKEKIFANQTENDYAVLNYDDPYCRKMKPPCKVIWFSAKEILPNGCYMDGDEIKMQGATVNVSGIRIMLENALAAAAICLLAGVGASVIESVFKSFKGVEHRIEYVASVNGVEYFNDSKATNADSAIKGLDAMKRPVVLIGGGYDKQAAFDGWVSTFQGKVKKLIVMGETANQIIETCKAYNFTEYERVNSLRDAVTLAAARAVPGDCVLLSPACASWDMFDNFEQRGEMFKEYVTRQIIS